MNISGKSIRPFIGSKNYSISREFYKNLGFEEVITSEKMSYFYIKEFGFYLQDAYVKDWVDNSMIFLEVDNLESTLEHRNEFFLHDPSGILWHFGKFHSLKH